MGIMCLKCGYIESGTKGLHIFSKCPNPNCGNTDRDQFIRIDDDEIDMIQHQNDREWLESHKED